MKQSLETKQLLAQTMIDLTKKKSFRKVSVIDISKNSGVNRQTFYYHFEDKYELLYWYYEQDAFAPLTQNVKLENWRDCIIEMLDRIQQQKVFYRQSATDAREVLEDCLFEKTYTLFLALFDRLDLEEKIPQEDRLFYARFFSYGFRGVLISWITHGYQENSETIALQIYRMAEDTKVLVHQLKQP